MNLIGGLSGHISQYNLFKWVQISENLKCNLCFNTKRIILFRIGRNPPIGDGTVGRGSRIVVGTVGRGPPVRYGPVVQFTP